jgi:hypothetical protein
MAEPTLTEVFGANAAQTSTTITITKADLTGLTASANNTAESLFVAILLKAASYLTDTNLQANSDQSISIESSFDSIVTRNNTSYRQKTYSVNLQKLDPTTEVDPDDY